MEPPSQSQPPSLVQGLRDAITKLSGDRAELVERLGRLQIEKSILPATRAREDEHDRLSREIAEVQALMVRTEQDMAAVQASLDRCLAMEQPRVASPVPSEAASSPVAPARLVTSAHSAARSPSVTPSLSVRSHAAAEHDDAVSIAGSAVTAASVVASSASRRKRRIPKDLPTFQITKNSIQVAEKFIPRFKRVMLMSDLNPDTDWPWLLPAYVEDTIATWLEECVPKEATWEKMSRRFVKQFGEPKKARRLRVELLEMRHGPKESAAQFCGRFMRLALEAEVADNNDVVVDWLISRLPPSTASLVSAALEDGNISRMSISKVTQYVASVAPGGGETTRSTTIAAASSERVSTPNQRPYCKIHRDYGHATADCRANNRANTYGDRNASRPMHSSGSKDQSARNRKRFSREPSRTNNGGAGEPGTREVLFTGANLAGSSFDQSGFISVLVNGVKIPAFIDSGASVTFLAKQFVDEHGIPFTPMAGAIHTASEVVQIPRTGITEPVHIVFGQTNVKHACEILVKQRGPPLLIGRDLLDTCQFRALGLPLEHIMHSDPPAPAVVDTIPAPADVDFAKVELELDFVAFREAFRQVIDDILKANAAVPANSHCPLPESIVRLKTPEGKVVHRRQYPIPHSMIGAIGDVIDQWLADGVITRAPVGTTFNTPIFAVPKKDLNGQKRCRVCADFRPLNALLPDDSFPLPLIGDIFKAIVGAVIFTTLDLQAAYHRFLIAVEDRHKTCFTWQDMQYVFARAPFGLKTLPSIFQRVIQIVLADMPFARAYIDDVIVFSKDRADHADHVRQVVQALTANNLVLNMEKCHFARLQITLLGFRITPGGRSVDPERLANVSDWPTPTTGKQLQHYLGFANYFREHMPLMSKVTSTLDSLRQVQDLRPRWTEEHDAAFDCLKEVLRKALPLAHPDFEQPFCIATDASAAGIGAVLYQQQPGSGKPRWISFQARALSKSERNYSATKRELLAIKFALCKFHYYIYDRHFTLFTDHAALTYFHSQNQLNPMLAGWYEDIFGHNFTIVHRPGILNILPDHLSRFFAPLTLEGGNAQPPREVRFTAVAEHTEDAQAEPFIEPEPDERAKLLDEHHVLGHFGVTAVVKSIRDAGFNWPNIHQEALARCQRCVQCLKFNTHPRAFHKLRSITAPLPFEHVASDLAGPFPTSRAGNHYIHVLIDVHSRFVLVKAIPDKRMETIAAVWLDIFTTFGFPKIVQSDNGTEFVNKTVKTMLDAAKIEQRFISPYHPRANGVAERAVQTVTRVVSKMLMGIKHNWDVYVPFAQYCINQKISERHRYRPFEVVFGRQANAFADYSDTIIPVAFEPSSAEHEQVIAEIREHVKFMQEQMFPEVASKSRAKADKTAKSFNKKKRTMDTIPINTFVMVRDNLRKSKLEPANKGPYKVVGMNKGGAYVLEDNEGQLFPHNFPPSALISLSTHPTFDQDSYEIEAILNHQETDDGMRYLVRWKHYSPEHDSWEPEENFDDYGVIHHYWSRRGQATTGSS